MNDDKAIRKALIQTGDGRSVFIWLIIFTVLLFRSIAQNGLMFEQFKYVGFLLIEFAIFCQFRVSDFRSELKTNIWGLINVNGFGLFLIYLEFFK